MKKRFNPGPNESRNSVIRATRAILVQRFPLAFMPEGSPKIPLKVGIARDVVSACGDIPADHINTFFGNYVGSYRYQEAIIAGEHRFDLEGKIAGGITEHEKNHARGILRKHERTAAEAKRVRDAKARMAAGPDRRDDGG